ncbi:recombination-associated protein RdgC [Shigella flexneri]
MEKQLAARFTPAEPGYGKWAGFLRWVPKRCANHASSTGQIIICARKEEKILPTPVVSRRSKRESNWKPNRAVLKKPKKIR